MNLWQYLKFGNIQAGTDSGGDFELQMDIASKVKDSVFREIFDAGKVEASSTLLVNGQEYNSSNKSARAEYVEAQDDSLGTGAHIYEAIHDYELPEFIGSETGTANIDLKLNSAGQSSIIDLGKLRRTGDDAVSFIKGTFSPETPVENVNSGSQSSSNNKNPLSQIMDKRVLIAGAVIGGIILLGE